MNILFIVKKFPKASETFIADQVRGMAERGHAVTVVALRAADVCADSFSGIAVHGLGMTGNDLSRSVNIVRIAAGNALRSDFRRFAKHAGLTRDILWYGLARIEAVRNADVVVVHYGDLALDYARMRRFLGIDTPFTAVFHGMDVARSLPLTPPDERTVLWDEMALGLPVSGFFRDRLIALGCPAEKLAVHHMGVDTERFRFRERHPAEGTLTLATVGRLVGKKGIDTAILGLARAIKTNPGAHITFDIVGDGPLKGELERLAAQCGVLGNVRFHGMLSPGRVAEVLDGADAFILPSRTAANGDMEGIPVSLMEAMSCGLAVISTRHSGIPELVGDGISGILVDEGDAEGVGDAIGRFVSAGDTVAAMGCAGNKRVKEQFDLSRQHEKLERLFAGISTGGRHND